MTCRTGYWSDSLTSYFAELFGQKFTGAFELSPLRKNDIEEIAEQRGINYKRFIEEIIAKEIQPLAINPLTLEILFDIYSHSSSFPNSKEELFFLSCKKLCTEPNFERQFHYPKTNPLSPEKRIALASRIAAVIVFCNKRVIDLKNGVQFDSDAISVDLLLEGKEYTDNYCFEYTQNDIIETITQTSLFSSRGNLQFGFSHLAYSEYLAAKFIYNHKFGIEQINSLIKISTDEESKIIPQMKEVAAWMSSIDSKVTKDTILNDPQNILYGDLEALKPEDKENLVSSLLDKLSHSSINDTDWGLRLQYKKLNHPKLSEQLKPYIEDKKCHFVARRVAINIVEACFIHDLNPSLISLALDNTEDLHIRKNAIHALAETGDIEVKKKLQSLATQPQEFDLHDEIKGNFIKCNLARNHIQ